MTVLKGKCRGCGADATLNADGLTGATLALAERIVANGLCDECGDKVAEARAAEESEVLRRRADELRARRVRESGVPVLPASFEWPSTEAGESARRWADRKALTLTLTGPVGVGKSTLAVAAFRLRCDPVVRSGALFAKPAAWRSATAYMAALGADFGSKVKEEAVELAQGGWMLGLDDLDKTRPTPYAAEAMFALIDGAVATRSPLIVTMNSGLAELASKFGGPGSVGDAIASRLAEGLVVAVGGGDRRMVQGRAA